jgi:large subunit ribosomal protein L25
MAITLKVTKRDLKTKPKALRAQGLVPGVFYGKKEASTPISIAAPEFLKVWRAAGESSVITLKGDDVEVESLITDVTRHPVSGVPQHVDFYVFEKGKKIKIKIPLEFTGTAPAVKDLGGSLIKVLHEIEIEALPKDLPRNIVVDISPLKEFSSVIKAKDIVLHAGVTLVAHADEVVASVAEPRKIEEEVVEAPVDLSTIEVAKKGKEAKEGEEGAEAPAAEAPKKEEKKK